MSVRKRLIILSAIGVITIVAIGVIAIMLLIVGIGAYQLLSPPVWSEKLSFKNSTGQYDVVTSYRNATDVSGENLSVFLASESPALEAAIFNDTSYRPVEYAVLLHDAAERGQINCSVVGTQISPAGIAGHAVVAFHTTDGGTVLIDPTAMNVSAADYNGLDFSQVQFLRTVWHETLPSLNASGAHPEISEYRDVRPISYAELERFLSNDTTVNRTYDSPVYTCLDFAATLHDAAEAQGIENGVVSISFEGKSEGHAFNVFPTTDHGLVYIDSTGVNKSVKTTGFTATDNVVYLEKGMELGEFPVSQANGNLDYGFYLDRKAKMDAYTERWKEYSTNISLYNAEVDDYDNQTADNNRFYAAYNADFDRYSAAIAEYNRQMDLHNQAVLQNSPNAPPAPSNLADLQSWSNRLDDTYDQYSATWNRLDGWRQQLKSRGADLQAQHDSLVNAEEYRWITYTPPGVVENISVFWG
ncbi:MAG TPA: hypothetical protein VK436_14465 [Methanocella sp.]|nr:hypothetical protein [Methanocella sp.]